MGMSIKLLQGILVATLVAPGQAFAGKSVNASGKERLIVEISPPSRQGCSFKIAATQTSFEGLKKLELYGVVHYRWNGKRQQREIANRFWFNRSGKPVTTVEQSILVPIPKCGKLEITFSQADCGLKDRAQTACLSNITFRNKTTWVLTVK